MNSGKQEQEAPDEMTLRGRIRIGMAAQGIGTEAELARRMGVHRQTVNKWLNGEVENLDHEYLFKLADVLRCNARWLAIRDGSPQKPRVLDLEAERAIQVFEALRSPAMQDAWIRTGEAMVSGRNETSPAYPFKVKT